MTGGRGTAPTPGAGAALALCVLLLCAAASSRVALAGPPKGGDVERAQKHVDRGDVHFDAKRFELALAEYAAALAIAPHPDLLWNIARSQEEMKRYGEAIAVFEQYARLAPSPVDKKNAEEKVVVLRELLKAARKGSLTVMSNVDGARVRVGGVDVGTGRSVTKDLKPGRYRVRVTVGGYRPYQGFVRVEAGGRVTLRAVLKPQAPSTLLIRAVDEAGAALPTARVRVDKGAPVKSGTAILLDPGEHTLRLEAPGREAVERVILLTPGQRMSLDMKAGPLSAGATWTSWAGSYVVLTAADGAHSALLNGALLAIADKDVGQLVAQRESVLKPWRRKACSGAERVTWRTTYRARLRNNKTLRLDHGKVTECSCRPWCKDPPSIELPVIPLPHREGLVAQEVVFLRQALAGRATIAFERKPSAGRLVGVWGVDRWLGVVAKGETLSLNERLEGTLRRVAHGMVPSWKRAKCGGSSRFEQTIDYPARVVLSGERLTVKLSTGKEAACSCAGGCSTPPRLGEMPLRLLVYPRYLVGDGTVLTRQHSGH